MIDRPLGTKHPKYDVIYTVNYGYLPNTVVGDDLEQDAYVLGINQALKAYTGFCTAVIERHDDIEDKLVLVPDEAFAKTVTDKTIIESTEFIEQYFDTTLYRW